MGQKSLLLLLHGGPGLTADLVRARPKPAAQFAALEVFRCRVYCVCARVVSLYDSEYL